ncbi:hypothetical protein HYH02_001195 [Chlamydomonas schloesseri]|uniref:TRP C-terminal domain-containing protein n=1 Tax=Chlamydomonas schloesseri TaxID=2026947 RepID=A0A836BCX8_9CHLO|nr:hypothetical protein HYH02_001195 [Chlamydomonas schloesseri]|eukprot:KAG2454160.1 hypothetical protein HYH02_001195 [Chlamydomonas schloesseri]
MRLTVANCSFTDNSAFDSAGVFSVDDSESMFIDSTFNGNSAGRGREHDPTAPEGYGGALMLTSCRQSGANIINSAFTSNYGQGSGGAVMGSACRMQVEGSTFERNTAMDAGGAVYVIHRRSATSSETTLPPLKLMASNFTANTARGADGGAVLARNIHADVTGCRFDDNSAPSGRGGGCAVDNNLRLAATGNIFARNQASEGGAMLVAKTDNVTITGLTLVSNVASELGGGLSFARCPCVDVMHATVSNNTVGTGVTGSGGGIHLQQTTRLRADSPAACMLPTGYSARFVNLTVQGNAAAESGGAFLIGGFGDDVLLTNMTVAGNMATSGLGGGIAVMLPRSGGKGLVTGASYSNQLLGLALSNNSVAGDGGAVYLAGNVTATMGNSSLYGNAALGSGGAFKANDCNLLNVTNCTFGGNSATKVGGAAHVESCRMLLVREVWAVGNAAASAGGLAVLNPTLDGATVALVLNSTFYGQVAASAGSDATGYGGAMLISGRVAALVTDTRFESNYADTMGGAVLVDSTACQGVGLLPHPVVGNVSCNTVITSAKDSLEDLVFNNTARANGGAFYVTTSAGLHIACVRAAAPDCLQSVRRNGISQLRDFLESATASTNSSIATGYGALVASQPVRLSLEGAAWTIVPPVTSNETAAAGGAQGATNTTADVGTDAAAGQTSAVDASVPAPPSAATQLSSTLDSAPVISVSENGTVLITSFSNRPMDLHFSVYDAFDQVAEDGREGYRMGVVRIKPDSTVTYNSSTSTSSVCEPELKGSLVGIVTRGSTIINAFRARAPKGTFKLNITVEDMEFNTNSDDHPLDADCRRTNKDTANCYACPNRAVCPGGAVMFPEQGSWHSAANSTFFIECPNKEACRDGDDDAQEMLQPCQQWWYSQGLDFDYQAYADSIMAGDSSCYSDAPGAVNGTYDMDAACALWGLPYNHPAAYMTRQCSESYAGNAATIVLLAVFFLINTVSMFYTTLFTFMADYTQEEEDEIPIADILQVAIQHFQYYNIITGYGIDWPEAIQGLNAAFGMLTGNIQQQAFTPSCLLSPDASSQQQAEAEQYTALFSPAILLAAVLVLWGVRIFVWNARSLYGAAAEPDLRRLSQLPAPAPEDGAPTDVEKGDGAGRGNGSDTGGAGDDGAGGAEDTAPPPAPPAGFCSGLVRLVCIPVQTYMKNTYSMEGEEGKARWASLINMDRTLGLLHQFLIVVLVVAGILYPAWAQATLSIFSCYFLDTGEGEWPQYQLATSGTGYWVRDMNQACYTVLWLNRDQLQTVHVVQTYGFLYRRYTPECFFWGAISQVQMLLSVVVEVFGTVLPPYMQAVLLQISLISKMTIDSYFTPTKYALLANLEFLSMAVLSITISLGLFFLPPPGQKDPVTPAAEQGIAAIILVLNIGVCLYFMYVWWTNAHDWLLAMLDAMCTALQSFIAAASSKGAGGQPVPLYRKLLACGARVALFFVVLARTIIAIIMPTAATRGGAEGGPAGGLPSTGDAGMDGSYQGGWKTEGTDPPDDMEDAIGGEDANGSGNEQTGEAGEEDDVAADVGAEIFPKQRKKPTSEHDQPLPQDECKDQLPQHGPLDVAPQGGQSGQDGRTLPLRRRSRPQGTTGSEATDNPTASMDAHGPTVEQEGGPGSSGAGHDTGSYSGGVEGLTAEYVGIQLSDLQARV